MGCYNAPKDKTMVCSLFYGQLNFDFFHSKSSLLRSVCLLLLCLHFWDVSVTDFFPFPFRSFLHFFVLLMLIMIMMTLC